MRFLHAFFIFSLFLVALRAQAIDTWRVPEQMQWCLSSSGERSGIVNIYAHASLARLKAALRAAGYLEALPSNASERLSYLRSVLMLGLAAGPPMDQHNPLEYESPIEKWARKSRAEIYEKILHMPVSVETLDGKAQLASFEKDNEIFGGRHHLRIFSTGQLDENKNPVWAIAAIRDQALTLDFHQTETLFLYHQVDPDADRERNQVLHDLEKFEKSMRRFRVPMAEQLKAPSNNAFSRDRQSVEIYFH